MSDTHTEQPEAYVRHVDVSTKYDDEGRPLRTTTYVSQHLPYEKCRGKQCGD